MWFNSSICLWSEKRCCNFYLCITIFIYIYTWFYNMLYTYGCFLKWWYPTTMGFPTKKDHFGVFWGVPSFKETPIYLYINDGSKRFGIKFIRIRSFRQLVQTQSGHWSNKAPHFRFVSHSNLRQRTATTAIYHFLSFVFSLFLGHPRIHE